jgi:hypothetical protein
MEKYHMRRREKTIRSRKQMMDIIGGQAHMTIAMSKDNEPYLVTVNYSFDQEAMCLYFHSAQAGRKIDCLRSNPIVWGQVLEDKGYVQGECDYAYRTVMFSGRAESVTDLREKRRALGMMIDRLDSDPGSTSRKFMVKSALEGVAVWKIKIEGMSGKESLPPKV